jgi:hypothetical protein
MGSVLDIGPRHRRGGIQVHPAQSACDAPAVDQTQSEQLEGALPSGFRHPEVQRIGKRYMAMTAVPCREAGFGHSANPFQL